MDQGRGAEGSDVSRPPPWREVFQGRRGRLTAGLLLLEALVAVEALVVTTILPAVRRDLGGIQYYGWAFSATFLATFASIPIAGWATDRYGPKRPLAIMLGVYVAGLVIAGLAPSEVGLWVGTVVFAVGVAFTFPAIVALAVLGIPPDERGAVTGTTSLFIDVAFGLSPALLGLLAGVAGYPSTFLVSAAFAAVGAAWLLLRRRGGRAGAAARLSA